MKIKFGIWAAALLGLLSLPVLADDVKLKMFAPENGSRAGIGGRGWFVDLAIDFRTPLANSGFSGFQLTGPGVHDNAPPFPGTFSPGIDDRLPGLIVLGSTTGIGAGSCQNVANLFNLISVTDVANNSAQIGDAWIIGAPNFGVDAESTVYAAVAADHNGDSIFNDAPAVLPDADGNGVCDAHDLKAFGLSSYIARSNFYINP